MNGGGIYRVGGALIGLITWILTFIGVWIAAVQSWGWLIGLAFGWVPAAIIATMAAALVGALWPLLAVGIVLLLILIGQVDEQSSQATDAVLPDLPYRSSTITTDTTEPLSDLELQSTAEKAATAAMGWQNVPVETGQSYEDVYGQAECTDDCGGHNAGYAWAEENGVTDSSECSGNSLLFAEGCEAWAEEQEEDEEE